MHGEVLALVVDQMLLLRQEALAGFLVVNEGAVFPSVPECFDDLEEFLRLGVAVAMRRQPFETKIARRIVVGGGHHVPGGAPVRDVIQRREQPRNIIGLVEAG